MSYRTRMAEEFPVLKRVLYVRQDGDFRMLHSSRSPRAEQTAASLVEAWRRHVPKLREVELLVIETRAGSVARLPFPPESLLKGAA
jgi:hypothetical protein